MNKKRGIKIFYAFLLSFLSGKGPSCGASTLNKRIQQKLFENYDKSKIIFKDVSNTTVKVGVSILHLDVDEKNRILVTDAWLRLKWVDKDLVWDKTKFGNISVVRVDYDKVWKPDLVLYNNAHATEKRSELGNQMILVYNTGDILWIPNARYHSWCELNLRKWPMDIQTCALKFGSWTHSGDEIKLDYYASADEPKVDLSDYETLNHEWKVITTSGTHHIKKYDCCTEEYHDMEFEFTLQRSSEAYKSIIVLPAFILMLVTISSFLLPSDSSGKLTTNGFSLLGSLLYLIYFGNTLPFHEVNVPIVVILYANHAALTGIAIFLNIICIRMVKEDKANAPPRLFKLIFKGIVLKILCLSEYEDLTSPQMRLRSENEEDRQNIILNRSSSTTPSEIVVYPSKNIIMREWMFVAAGLERIFLVLYVISFLIVSFTYA